MIADYFVSDLPPPPPEAYEEEHIGHQSKTFRLLEKSINSGGTLSSLSWDIYIYIYICLKGLVDGNYRV
jgi:hypothetical protein